VDPPGGRPAAVTGASNRVRRPRSNAGIADALVLTVGAVEKHVASILQKLRLPPAEDSHRRVLAVPAYLEETAS